MVFLPCFCSWSFIFKVCWINCCSWKMPRICRNIVFLSHFLQLQTYNLFYLDFLYLGNQKFLVILFYLFLCPIFFRYLFCLMVSSVWRYVGIYIFLKYGFCALFLLIFAVKFWFLKSIESISVLKKWTASASILFFCVNFWRYQHMNYFIISFSWDIIFFKISFSLIFFDLKKDQRNRHKFKQKNLLFFK